MGSRGAEYLLLLLIFLLERSNCLESSDDKPKLTWVKPGLLTHQSLHSVLVAMEERLRSMESMKYTTNRIDLYLKTFARQLDSLDVRTRAVQIKLEQLETVAQSLVSHELKNDLSTVHLQRKFETNQDRLIHKISLTENRLDSSITKFQGTIDLGFEKIEKKQNEYQNKLNSMNAVLEEISARLMKIEDNTNSTTNFHHSKISASEDFRNNNINRITDMLEGIEKHVNRSIMLSEQNDSPKKQRKEDDKIKEIIRTELHSEANKIGNKINNMYDELWVKTDAIEGLIKDVALTSNMTDEKVNYNRQSKTEDIKCSETIQSVMGEIMGTLGSSLQEKLKNVDTNVEGIFATHNMLLGAYNKMREDENQFETKLTYVLGKILDTIENRTKSVDDIQKKTLEALKSHNSQVVRTVAYNTNFLKKMAEDTGVEHKNVESVLVQLLSYMNPDKNDSQEYEDNINDPYRRRQLDDLKEETDVVTNHSHRASQIKPSEHDVRGMIQREESNSHHRPNNHTDDKPTSFHRTPLHSFPEESTADFDDSHDQDNNHVSSTLEDENDKAVTRLLMLYLKALKGHLSKDKFLYEANPQQPYSSVQDMVKKLKDKHFPSYILKELEDWDSETNDKEVLEEMTEAKEFTDNPLEDYFPDKDYLDYPVRD